MNQIKTTKENRTFRKLEDLNVIDNFLFQSLLSQEQDGEEFARILLSTILEKNIRNVKIVPQKNILGLDTTKHGIRLDAYIEDVSDELNSNVADVEIIVILPYDPFDKNRMVYTISNHCVEDTSIPYNDGAKKIFLYTKGTEGNPSQALKDMLKYIEKSTKDNVTNQDIASIQELVNKVKRKREVGINYMKSWEMEELARKQGYAEGHDEGLAEGYNEGYCEMQEKLKQLARRLTEADRMEDLIKATTDTAYQAELFKEFNL